MTTLQILRRGRKRIEGGWCRGFFEKKHAGRTCFCTLGAILDDHDNVHVGAYRALKEFCSTTDSNFDPVVKFNDAQKDKRPVLRLFDRAIAAEIAKSR